MTILQKSAAMIEMIRPELPIAAGVCVVLGQAVGLGALPGAGMVALGFLLGVCLSGSAMVFNDYFDLEVDKVNAPQRPLPSGRVSPAEAIALGVGLALAAAVIAWRIHPIALGLSAVTWGMGFWYNAKLKAAGLAGNLVVSSSVGMTFIMGGVSVGQASNPMVWIFGAIAFFFDLGEEIAGDAMDMEGDQKRGSRSLALMYGRRAALRVSCALFGGVVGLTLLPVAWGQRSLAYLIPIAVTDGLIVFFTARLWQSATPQAGRRAMRWLYMGATMGLGAFLVSAFVR